MKTPDTVCLPNVPLEIYFTIVQKLIQKVILCLLYCSTLSSQHGNQPRPRPETERERLLRYVSFSHSLLRSPASYWVTVWKVDICLFNWFLCPTCDVRSLQTLSKVHFVFIAFVSKLLPDQVIKCGYAKGALQDGSLWCWGAPNLTGNAYVESTGISVCWRFNEWATLLLLA